MPVLFKNNATATLAVGISTSTTTIVLSSGLGALFPAPSGTSVFYGTLYDSLGNYEIVKCTARTTDSITVVRGQEGTTPLAFNINDGFSQRLTAADLNNFVQLDADNALTGHNTFSASNTFSGGNSFTGSNNFTGNNTFSASNNFTGPLTALTATAGTSDTTVATTAFVTGAIPTSGFIKQIVSQRYTNSTQTTSGSYIDTFNTITITPTSVTSKILVWAESMVAHIDYSGAAIIRLVRNGSTVVQGDHYLWASNGFNAAPYQTWSGLMLHGVDQPGVIVPTTYTVQLKNYNNGSSIYGAYDSLGTVITAMEVSV